MISSYHFLCLVFMLIVLANMPGNASAKNVIVAEQSKVQEKPIANTTDRPSWLIRAQTGLGAFSEGRLSLPLGIQVGRLWPRLGLGIDIFGELITATSGVSVTSNCLDDSASVSKDCIASAELGFFSGRVGLSPHYGGTVGRAWVYGKIPIFVSMHPLTANRKPRISIYMNYGAGFGMFFPFAQSGIVGFEVTGFVGTALTPIVVRQLQGPIRGGGEAKFQIGWKL